MKNPLVPPKPIPVPRAAPLVAATHRRAQRVARLARVVDPRVVRPARAVDPRVARPVQAVDRRAARPPVAALRRAATGARVVVPTSIAARDLSVVIVVIVVIVMIGRRARR